MTSTLSTTPVRMAALSFRLIPRTSLLFDGCIIPTEDPPVLELIDASHGMIRTKVTGFAACFCLLTLNSTSPS